MLDLIMGISKIKQNYIVFDVEELEKYNTIYCLKKLFKN